MMPCSMFEKVILVETVEQARKKEQLLKKNKEAARALLLEVSAIQVYYVTERKNEFTD